MRQPELQDWQGPTLIREQPVSAAKGAEGGAQRPAADTAAVSSVMQAWHPTGILFELVFYIVCALGCIGPTISLREVTYWGNGMKAEVSCLGSHFQQVTKMHHVYDHHQQPISSILSSRKPHETIYTHTHAMQGCRAVASLCL